MFLVVPKRGGGLKLRLLSMVALIVQEIMFDTETAIPILAQEVVSNTN